MALSGFGLNAAVQAFPAMYEFGRSLFGQDSASKAQAFKEKQAEADLALKQKQLEDEAAYRAGMLRGQDFQNQTSRMGVENAYNLGNRGLANQEYDSVTRATLGFGNLGVAQEHNRISRDQVNNAFTLGQGNLKVAQGQLGVAQQSANDIRDFRTASIEAEKARIRQEGERIGLTRQELDARIKHLDEQTRGLRLDNNFQDNLDKELAAESSLEERFQNDPLSLSEKDLTKLGMRYNRHAKEAAEAFNEAADRWVASNGKDTRMFSPEVVAAVGRGIQPLLDMNTKYPKGSLRFDGFEPAEKNGERGVLVRLKKTVAGDDGQMRTTPTYLTEGRGDTAEGFEARIFTGRELNQMLSGLQSVGELQEKHGDLSADMQDKLEARKMSKNYQEFARNYRILRDERMAAMGRAEDKAAKLVKDQAAQAAANTRDVMTALDNVHPIRQLQPEDGGKATPEYQALMAEREKLQSIIGQQLSKGELEDLEAGDPVGIMAHPDVAKQYEKYKSLYQRYVPPATDTTMPVEGAKHPQQGAFYHPGVQSSGGGASPFSQAAPERGGSPMGLSRYLTPDKDPNYSLAHMRAPFADRLAAMLEDAPKGVNVYSGWRSREHQARLFNASDRTGHKVAHPGHSNHEHGIAADLKFANKAAREWVHRNAPRYGLSFRMAHENWHIEPAGAGPDARNWGV